MKNMMKKMALLSVVATLSLPTFAGVVEHELAAGDSAVSELVFVAKTNKTSIIRIGQPGIADDLRDGALDVAPDETYGFAFGQPDGGAEPNAWENYVINTVGPLAGSMQQEICGDATANAANAEQMIHAYGAQTFTPDVASLNTLDLSGSCVVTESAAEDTVAAIVKVGYEVLVSGGSSIDLDLSLDNGIQADLVTDDATMEFATFAVSETHYDSAGAAQVKDIQAAPVNMGHGDHGLLEFDIQFEASGLNAKPERRASAILTAAVPL